MDKAFNIVADTIPLLEQMAGKGRGRVFELSIDEIRLGREEDNDIVIDDESVSRLHARIEKSSDGTFVIKDNQSKNGIFVNKEKVTSHILSHGDIVQMGHFVFRFRIPGMSSPEIVTSQTGSKMEPFMDNLNKEPGNNRKRLYLWGGVLVVIAVMWSLNNSENNPGKSESNDTKAKEESFTPTSVPDLDNKANSAEANGLSDPLTKVDKELSNIENGESAIRESELYFRRGQRDYFNKNYHHAIDNFDTAISLWGKHPLASYYRGLAIHDSETEAQKNREIGLKYFNSLQYSRARYHFKLAIDYLSHIKGDNKSAKKVVQDSERYIDYIDRKLKAAEMVP